MISEEVIQAYITLKNGKRPTLDIQEISLKKIGNSTPPKKNQVVSVNRGILHWTNFGSSIIIIINTEL